MGVAASQNGPIDLSSLLEPKASPDQKRRNQLKSNILMPRNINTSTLVAPHVSIRQCQLAKPSKMAFRATKSPTITIHLIIRFD